jgi:hypothetical protein
MAKKCSIKTPMEGVPTPKMKGGPGVYDGEKGYPSRTKSPNAPPEKVRDK